MLDTLSPKEAVQKMMVETKVVRIPGTDAGLVRSKIGDLLARRPAGMPAWWDNRVRKTSPYRVFPDLDGQHVRIAWVPAVDEEMQSVVRFAYPEAEHVSVRYEEAEGDTLYVQFITPVYYAENTLKYLARKNIRFSFRQPPRMDVLIPLTRQKFSTMAREWFSLKLAPNSFIWYDESSLVPGMQYGSVMQTSHTNRQGYKLECHGFVGQVMYHGRPDVVADGHVWLQMATLWGIASGTTWGWGTLWERCIQLSAGGAVHTEAWCQSDTTQLWEYEV
ncbi:hypothetical protein [Alicyclobacillus macrosporangiidus]|uniref:Uncharacterized protein n=1 Tax=Alicyclobacillus macrosporangiidus TaxID=392015 RepID=A0A1I7KC57_9BACL|nr:hypothetical protein [Alicyclobacillus macrosporangiidus]SFU94987.1 hypothetical protein SAMN05421543_11518 [Alicyclobacillus macrosporangiidus]